MTPPSTSADLVVVGSGVAGLSAALEAARLEPEARVLLATKSALGSQGASPLAQGGIAAAIDPSDSPSLHADDTVTPSGGLARRDLVEILTREGPGRVHELAAIGARFDRDGSGGLLLGLEGAHSKARIVHAHGDQTGAELTRALKEGVRESGRIEVREGTSALSIVSVDGRCHGVIVRDGDGRLEWLRTAATVLATGGAGRAYLRTTSPPGLEGDGLVMAARAGAELQDLEFVQFHPTALRVATDPLPLVTEALRGAGGRLVDGRGESIVGEGDDELAPRDRVARLIWSRMKAGVDVFLDVRPPLVADLEDRFPGVLALCRRHGVDPLTERVPVTPAAHYHMGGISVDDWGRSSLAGLWAVGEVAASGVHGANRLASNSLLEGLVFGPRAAASALDAAPSRDAAMGPVNEQVQREAASVSVGSALPTEATERLRRLLWEKVGVIREASAIEEAETELREIERSHAPILPSSGTLLLAARAIARAAARRHESLGSHWRSDASGTSDEVGLRCVVTFPAASDAADRVTPISAELRPDLPATA